MIYCTNDRGQVVAVAPDALQASPAVYGIMIDEYEQVLLLPHEPTELWRPPGGLLTPQQTPQNAVRHFFRQVTGMTAQVLSLIYVEDQYRIVEEGQAYRLSMMYYALRKSTFTAVSLDPNGETAAARWLPIAELQPANLLFGWEAIRAARLHHAALDGTPSAARLAP